jgi:hypothetical protein
VHRDLQPLDARAAACATRAPGGERQHWTGRNRVEGEVMTGDAGRQVCEAMVPQEEIDRLCQEFGVIERQRKRNLGRFVWAMGSSAGTPGGASQADVLRSSLACEVPHVARSACSRCCDAPLERLMAAPGLAAGRVLSVGRAGLRAERDRSPQALEQDRGVAHPERERPQLAPSALRLRSTTRLETPAPCAQGGQRRGRQSSS